VTLASSPHARLYQRSPGRHKALWGCAYSSGRQFRLTDPDDGDFAFPPPALRVTARIAAFAWDDWDNVETHVRTVDLRYGFDRDPPNPGTPTFAGRSDFYVKVGSMALGADNALVWITCPENPDNGNPTASRRPGCAHSGRRDTVWAVSATGGPKVRLDRGRTIDPSSLTRRGSRYCWRHAGKRRCKRV
jgi:hypothetical protein